MTSSSGGCGVGQNVHVYTGARAHACVYTAWSWFHLTWNISAGWPCIEIWFSDGVNTRIVHWNEHACLWLNCKLFTFSVRNKIHIFLSGNTADLNAIAEIAVRATAICKLSWLKNKTFEKIHRTARASRAISKTWRNRIGQSRLKKMITIRIGTLYRIRVRSIICTVVFDFRIKR